jgi:hypothetical protein
LKAFLGNGEAETMAAVAESRRNSRPVAGSDEIGM